MPPSLTSTEAITIEIAVAVLFAVLAAAYITTNWKTSKEQPYLFLSAYKSQDWKKITVSLLATYVGNWTIFLPASFGAMFGIFGVLAYAISSVLPVVIIAFLGSYISQNSYERIFTSADYFRQKYGLSFHIILSLFSLLYMWVFLTSELTTIASTLGTLTNFDVNAAVAILPIAISTLIYTSYSGLPASLFTDQFQGILVVLMGIITIISAAVANPIDSEFWKSIPFAPPGAWLAGINLIITVYPSELLNQSAWQRILSCKTPQEIKKSCFITSIVMFVIVAIFGFLGVIAGYLFPVTWATDQIFNLISPLGNWILIVVLIFAVALVSSSVDSLQNGMVALLGSHLMKYNLSMNWARMATILINIPAVIVASFQLNIFNLFYTANLLCLCVVGPQLLSFIPFCTSLGAILGSIVGFLTIPVVGWIYTQSFWDGILYFYPSDISHISYFIIGILSPVLSCLTTWITSKIDRKYKIMQKN